VHEKSADVFTRAFKGYAAAHGLYNPDSKPDKNGKILGTRRTVQEPVEDKHYKEHLEGVNGLGVIPVNQFGLVNFAAIDIDDYSVDLKALVEKLAPFPIIPCTTKSGGLHAYVFFKESAKAEKVIKKLEEIAAAVGYGSSEIFPKQVKILSDRGDVGSWINLPYFNAAETKRYALVISESGKLCKLDLEEFLALVKERAVDADDFDSIEIADTPPLPGAPPCLTAIIEKGFPDGARNKGLFNLGVYSKKANGKDWQTKIYQYNQKHIIPPLGNEEVDAVIKSLDKKKYTYTCKDSPVKAFCNFNKCRTCKHGLDGGGGLPAFRLLTKLCTDPPIWFLDVEDLGRMELSTDELQKPQLFQKRCMDALNIMPPVLKQADWAEVVRDLLANCEKIDVPQEMTLRGIFLEHLEDFLTGKLQANVIDEVILGRTFLEDGKYYFKVKDLGAYLDRQKFQKNTRNWICMVLKELGAKRKQFHLKGKCVGLWVISGDGFTRQTEKFDTPNEVTGDVF